VVELIPAKQKELKEVSTKYGDKALGQVTVSQVGASLPIPFVCLEQSPVHPRSFPAGHRWGA